MRQLSKMSPLPNLVQTTPTREVVIHSHKQHSSFLPLFLSPSFSPSFFFTLFSPLLTRSFSYQSLRTLSGNSEAEEDKSVPLLTSAIIMAANNCITREARQRSQSGTNSCTLFIWLPWQPFQCSLLGYRGSLFNIVL